MFAPMKAHFFLAVSLCNILGNTGLGEYDCYGSAAFDDVVNRIEIAYELKYNTKFFG
jgi:hypothetical protein